MQDSLTYKPLSELASLLEIYHPQLHAPLPLSVFFRPPYLYSFNQFLNHLTKFIKRIIGATLLEDKQLPAMSNNNKATALICDTRRAGPTLN
jgi:hypothetical protein